MSNPRSLKFLQITDTHLLGDRDGLLRDVPTFATLQAVQAHAAEHFRNPDGVLLTGDLVQDDAAGYALIREAFGNSTVPVYCIPGNHDLPDDMRESLNQSPFVLDDHRVLGSWLLVLLNSWQAGSAWGALGHQQLERLDALLTQHAHHHVLICLHHHPIAMHSAWLDKVGLQDAPAFEQCLQHHDNVRGVVWGHVHQTLDVQRNGVRYMATPSTCAQFLPNSTGFAVDSRPPGYRTLTLHPDGSLDTEVIWL